MSRLPKGNFESLFSFYLAEFQISAMGCSAFVVEGGIALKSKVIPKLTKYQGISKMTINGRSILLFTAINYKSQLENFFLGKLQRLIF